MDLVFLGTGSDGEIGHNEPGSSLQSVTRPKTLAYDTLVTLMEKFGEEATMDDIPKVALTMGVKTIIEARDIAVVFGGVKRSYALSKCVEDGVNHMFPVSVLQRNDSVRCPVNTRPRRLARAAAGQGRGGSLSTLCVCVCVWCGVCVCGHSIEPADQ